MAKKTSEAMVAQVAKFEGFRAKAYKCPAGVWTIGFGHTGPDVTANGVMIGGQVVAEITEAVGRSLLAKDLETAEKEVAKVEQLLNYELLQNEFDALVSLVYNIGAGNFRTSTLRKVILAGHPTDTAVIDQFMRWNKAGGVVQPGLVKRRAMEAAWWAIRDEVRRYAGDSIVTGFALWLEEGRPNVKV